MVAILSTLVLGAISVFLGLQLVSAVSIVASWLSLAAGIAIGLGLTYYLYTDGYLSEFFDLEEIELFSSLLVGVVSGFVAYRLIEGLLAVAGVGIAFVAAALVLASIVFSPAVVLGGIARGIEGIVTLVDALGGEN